MMSANDVPLQTRFDVLCQIVRAQHFAWREAVAQLCPDVDPAAVSQRMWEITGKQTAASYAKRLKTDEPLAPQLARSFVWSSLCMGEDATVETGDAGGDEAFVRHSACPWHTWHKRVDALPEDRPGCDAWFEKTAAGINEALGTNLRVETREALPDGGSCCLRRVWNEQR